LADWVILQSPEFKDWYRASLTDDERDAIVATALRLQADGPALRRPLSGIIKGSKFPNMKELIPTAGNIRILYIFDPERRAIFLLGGDKTDNWSDWYKTNIPTADAIYERHLAVLAAAAASQRPMGRKRGRTR
jgi:hypothetical protein